MHSKKVFVLAATAALALGMLPSCSHKGVGPSHRYKSADEWERATRHQKKAYTF